MSDHSKVFQYQVNGLSYTVTVYEKDGVFVADITVNEGAMDVNAVYFGDDIFSGPSDSLKGPLNMNGAGSTYEGETVQWDDAIKLSDPGLGRLGADKPTYLTEGQTLTVELSIDSLDDIDFFGVRATSTSTDGGSIKGVSGDPEEEGPDEPLHDKVFFADEIDDQGRPVSGVPILAEEPVPNEYNTPFLPEGTEPTFENYVTHFESLGGDVDSIQSILFYDVDENGGLTELFRIDAPDGGFADANALLDAYDDAIDQMDADANPLIALTAAKDEDFVLEGEPEDLEEDWIL